MYICKKLSYLPKKVLETIYYGYVYSILNYGIIIWGGAYPTSLRCLKSIQDKFKTILKSETIPSFEQLYVTKCILHHYETLSSHFTSSNSITRNKSIELPLYRKTVAQKNSFYTAVKFFNKLPNDLKTLNESNKIKMKKILSQVKQLKI